MTPTYAAPEMFDDEPSAHSDQYSLAIVYQEMLRGHVCRSPVARPRSSPSSTRRPSRS